jgi:hypothetical protein
MGYIQLEPEAAIHRNGEYRIILQIGHYIDRAMFTMTNDPDNEFLKYYKSK